MEKESIKNEIKVIIVDDSATVRLNLKRILNSDKDINVIAAVSNPIIALKWMKDIWPDVIITDVELPKLDGISFIKEVFGHKPVPFIICSSIDPNKIKSSFFSEGFEDIQIILKPEHSILSYFSDARQLFIDSVKTAFLSSPKRIKLEFKNQTKILKNIKSRAKEKQNEPKLSPDVILAPWSGKRIKENTDRIVAIGASAGGIKVIEKILMELPEKSPGIVIVQHLPVDFTNSLANRLNSLCKISVKEADNGDVISDGLAFIAPGDQHILIRRKKGRYVIELRDGPLVTRHRPSVDVLFRSAAKSGGKNILGIILTGMGDDGAREMLTMHEAGSPTIAQDKNTCAVFGMPAEAIKLGGVDLILPMGKISDAIIKFYQGKLKWN
ncbi:chemotaxis-specific protein-glutamate methyltransferase CheB [Spirochaetota bacterium]